MLALGCLALPGAARAQLTDYEIKPLTEEGAADLDTVNHVATATNGVVVRYGGAILTAERVTLNWDSGQIEADGGVRIERDEQLWVSDHLAYNFKTRQIQATQFRTGKPPIFAAGRDLHADLTNQVYVAKNAFITADDVANPAIKVRAKYIRIIPGRRIEAHHAVLYLAGVPVFYFPYYSRNLVPRSNNFNFVPGYRSRFGPYLLGSYNWFLTERLDGIVHVDYRERRGVGTGPDFSWHLGRWGEGNLKYYYAHDLNPNLDLPGADIPSDRQRVSLAYQATPFTNLNVKTLVRYQSDTNLIRDFFETEYRHNPQPSTFVEVNKFWQNFSLDTYVQPRVNDFLETVERLPEVRLTGFRQQLGPTPLYYESQSSIGYYRRLFAETNSLPTGRDYEAARADSFHQLLLPYTFFGWLNLTPRAGGRFSYYGQASGPGAATDEVYRGVFNTGAELSFKASRLWPTLENQFLQLDGLRHIVQPSLNYVYVPTPDYHRTHTLPQFDSELPSLRLLPIEYPDYNAIDSIDSQNVLRLGLNNKLQTKRDGEVVNFLNWDFYTDWRLRPRSDQTTFADLYSDLTLRPQSWIALESITRYDLDTRNFRLAFHTLSLQPNQVWSWSFGHLYLRDDLSRTPTSLGEGNDLFTSSIFLRLSEDWGLRASHRFEARDGRLEEQAYSIYRDLRSWTAALTFRLLDNRTGPSDFTVALTFSLKAFPRFGLGADSARPFFLLGN
jgi:lipopolysaccharide assembly outer membrane protein LptD (OstA)